MIYVITGPTSTGKDRIAIDLAKRIGGEIINADAFHVYRQLDIGTNKPRESDFQGIRHHLFSYVDVDETYSIARYQKDARSLIEKLLAKKIPLIMLGGSGLYIKAALFDYRFREEKTVDMSVYEAMENKQLHDALAAVDPTSANKIHPNNRRRVLRALSIYFAQNIKKSDIPIHKDGNPIYDTMFFAVEFDRAEVYLAISNRVHRMISEGLVEEVEKLIAKYGDYQQAFNAIGYKEIIEHLHGEATLEEAINKIITNTRNYSKRQTTFFRHQFSLSWIRSADDIIKIIEDGKTT